MAGTPNTPTTDKAWITRLRNFGIRTANRSPLVARVGQIEAIGDYPACATCPSGMWLVTDDLYCFCKMMKQYSFGAGRTPVIACDERELLLAEEGTESGAALQGRR